MFSKETCTVFGSYMEIIGKKVSSKYVKIREHEFIPFFECT